jgi:hypothetical protein
VGRQDCLLLSSPFHLILPLCIPANTWLRRCCRSRIPVYLRVRPSPHYLLPPTPSYFNRLTRSWSLRCLVMRRCAASLPSLSLLLDIIVSLVLRARAMHRHDLDAGAVWASGRAGKWASGPLGQWGGCRELSGWILIVPVRDD